MSSHKIRSILAAAALAAGVSWLVAAPADAGTCGRTTHAAEAAERATGRCGERSGPRLSDGLPAGREIAPEAVSLAMAAGRVATEAGLTGLATARPAPGLLDLGGVVATWGMPSLAAARPELLPTAAGPVGMKDLATEAHVPDLPVLPVSGMPVLDRLPGELTPDRGAFHHGITAAGDDPADVPESSAGGLEEPVREIGSDVVTGVLPKAVQGLGGTSVLPGLPGGGSGIDGLAGLVEGFGLR